MFVGVLTPRPWPRLREAFRAPGALLSRRLTPRSDVRAALQHCTSLCTVARVTAKTLRMPVSVAARKGVSAVAATAADQRVVLTSLGRPVAVVDAADRLDEAVRTMR